MHPDDDHRFGEAWRKPDHRGLRLVVAIITMVIVVSCV